MPKHEEIRHLNFSSEKLFELVADIERYPEFLPWCLDAKIIKKEESAFYAELTVGYKWIKEIYRSKVILTRPNVIKVEYLRGPFKYLENYWHFHPKSNGCEVKFYIDFEFRSLFLRKVIGPFFGEAVARMVKAFENRAKAIYEPLNQGKAGKKLFF